MAKDFTKGNSLTQIIWFTIPLILGNVFQLTYNMVDSIIIGRYASKEALAAVGTSDPIMSLIILGVSGMCVGASVLMSQFFGSKQYDKLKEEMKTTVYMGTIFSIVVFILGMFISRYLLMMLKTPSSILSMATLYLRIIFIGMPFTVLYNIYAAALRSIGNSKTPIYYLIFSSILNGCLDFIFIYFFHLGVIGASMATVIAQAMSAILCVMYVRKNVEYLQFELHPSMNTNLVKQTISYGGFSALQQCAQPIGKLFIQGMVNSLGVPSIAAFVAIGKIEDLGLVPGRNISDSIMTFTAQNKGANQKDRIEHGFKQGMILELCTGIVISLLLFIFRKELMGLFTKDALIIQEGVSYFSVMFLAYALSNCSNGNQGYFRGIGYMKTTLFGTITQITIRVIVTYILISTMSIKAIGIACMAGWFVQFIWQSIYRKKVS